MSNIPSYDDRNGKRFGAALPAAMAAQAMSAPPQMQLAQPINDIQVIAMLAAHLVGPKSTTEAVTAAMDILAETIVQCGPNLSNLFKVIKAKQDAALLLKP